MIDLEQVARDWIAYVLTKDERYSDAYWSLGEIREKDPDAAWDIILRITQQDLSNVNWDLVAGMIGVNQLEGLLEESGDKYIGIIEEEIKGNMMIKISINCIYAHHLKYNIRQRVEAINIMKIQYKNGIW